jgi:hypothetical protein
LMNIHHQATAKRHHRISCNGRAHERLEHSAQIPPLDAPRPIGRGVSNVATGHDAENPTNHASFSSCGVLVFARNRRNATDSTTRCREVLPTSTSAEAVAFITRSRSDAIRGPRPCSSVTSEHSTQAVDHGGKSYRRSGLARSTQRRLHLLTAAINIA